MDDFLGTWKMTSSEGFDRVMTRLGVDFLTRKAGNAAKPVIKLSEVKEGAEPKTYCLKTINAFRSTEVQFRLQEPFLETTPDGRKVKTVISLEKDEADGKWVLRQCQVGDKVTDIDRRLDDIDLMRSTIRVEELVSVRMYRRVKD
ncbi:Fatty acid-binding -like protein 2 [Echinococcus granulosus]|uniref:Fatty acid-binding protein n=2 Tax=Echinococcus TaxID=6209 RepID=U6JF40_ECHGR|nr:Fatty acid-binding protein [Echinococcus granulosus]QIR83322.1 FABP3 [Echinococcus multilocularis]EUB60228.1 Fatty acid-binding protein [Echinococcus granulosus]KAH9278776.1 Fatty acid-binding -like protein 2 [Echinococcus granulosus]CDS21097.1 fatty acids and retinol binding protein [Echinococcus granulosus]CDS38180.1 fatty acids and retinol binding protein [Echinococcus multilocularis]